MVHVDNEAGIPHYWGKTGKGLQRLITIVATTDFLLFGYGMSYHVPRPQQLGKLNLESMLTV